ncbi:MAG: copper homeostasis protein CutC [Saprospiraceae bacterium]|jgi:copper homeostasis protein|nr:copper homeostasis protein CutC [Saprospiraceae bacterium]MBK6476789.1 copper homeostasis protein CutC [Saprospiraceae bacterium]MBK6816187.1 copper homeostasis protein CutC [Saprospiraceae bacterium]MBK7370298.1 copper homeostasis protein CutC [Saprospiraceae bacterium]MBK7438006.1 copper homeostasis protein CutC [Saprospiraceae bacterium]
MVTVEICAQSYQAAINAYEGGAHRIELCRKLPGGGLTPSITVIRQVCQEINIPVYVLIRPREGDFVFNAQEINAMQLDIAKCLDAGASGIVCGVLDASDSINVAGLSLLVAACQGMPFTFHRAFEQIKDQDIAIQQMMSLGGVHRILTGGKTGNAYQCRKELKELNFRLGDQIILLAGSGVTSANASSIVNETGVTEIHASAKYTTTDDWNKAINPYDSDPQEVRRIVAAVK